MPVPNTPLNTTLLDTINETLQGDGIELLPGPQRTMFWLRIRDNVTDVVVRGADEGLAPGKKIVVAFMVPKELLRRDEAAPMADWLRTQWFDFLEKARTGKIKLQVIERVKRDVEANAVLQ